MSAWIEARRVLALGVGNALNAALGCGSDHLIRDAERMDFWDAPRLLEWRRQRLLELVRHAVTNVPYYRERIGSFDFKPELSEREILSRVPILGKDDLRKSYDRMIATDRKRHARSSTTSGSTGSPVTVMIGDEACGWARVSQRRAFRRFGVEPMEPRMMLLAAKLEGRLKIRHTIADALLWRRLYEFAQLEPRRLQKIAGEIARYRPAYVTAYPSVLHALCWACIDGGISLEGAGVRLVHAQSEVLEEIHTDAIRRVFGPSTPILNEYGCVEVGGMAHSCPKGQLHPAHDHVIFEVVRPDGEPASFGEVGRVLLTPLHARAMPLLRYDLGDAAVLGSGSCACGRMPGLPLVDRLEGRSFETIKNKKGQTYSGGIVHFIVKKAGATSELREYLAVQRVAGALEFQAVPVGAPPIDLEARLRKSASEVFGDTIDVSCQIRSEVDRPSGKKRAYFVSQLRAGAS